MERRSPVRAGSWAVGTASVLVLLCPATAWADPAAVAAVADVSGPAAATTVSAAAPPAFHEAPELGQLVIDPGSGQAASTLVTVRASAACPATSPVTTAHLLGPTATAADPPRPVAAAAALAITTPGPVARALDGDLATLARTAGSALVAGRYRVVLQCWDAGLTTVSGQFSGGLSVSDVGTWQAQAPVASVPVSPSATSPATPSALPSVGPTLPSTPATPAVPATPALPATPAATSPATTATATPVTVVTATTPGAQPSDGAAAAGASPVATPSSTSDPAGSPAPAVGGGSDALSAAVGAGAGAGAAVNGRLRILLATSPVLGTLDLTLTGPDSSTGSSAVTSGTADTPFGVKPTPGGSATQCPAGTVRYAPTVSGPTAAWQAAVDGGAFMGSPAVGLLATFVNPSIQSFAAYAALNGLTIEPGKYTLAVVCYTDIDLINSVGQFTRDVYFVTATQWQLGDPATTTTTTTITLTAVPVRQVLGGGAVKLTATVAPSTAVGAVQFLQADNSGGRSDFPAKAQATDPSTAVPLQSGTATYSTSTLAVGLYPFAAAFVPTNPQKFAASSTPGVVQVAVVPPPPPTPGGAAVLSGTPSVGSTLTCAATFTGATSTAWAWIRDYDTVLEATGSTYAVVAEDKGHTLRCRALATNAGGTIGRTSTALAVPA